MFLLRPRAAPLLFGRGRTRSGRLLERQVGNAGAATGRREPVAGGSGARSGSLGDARSAADEHERLQEGERNGHHRQAGCEHRSEMAPHENPLASNV